MQIIKYLSTTFVLLTLFLPVRSQSLKYDDLIKVFITNADQLYYDYMLSGSDMGELSAAVNNDEKIFNDIVAHCTETGWPDKLNSFEWRKNNKSTIVSLVGYHITKISGFLSVVAIPKADNEEILKKVGVELKNDIYILIPTEFTKDLY